MKIYIVTDGEYSAYTIHGAFSTQVKADRYRRHYNFNAVETMDVDVDYPALQSDLVAYRYTKYFVTEEDELERRNTEDFAKTDWSTYGYPNRVPQEAYCDFLASDDQHAAKIARERLSALMSGSVLLQVYLNIPTAIMLEDGSPSATHTIVRYCEYYSLVSGSPVLVKTVKL